MTDSRPAHVAITGASGGLGRALALAYAEPGVRLSLAGRDADRLAWCARACVEAGALATTVSFDVRDRTRLCGWLEEADRVAPLDLVVANAGVSSANGVAELERAEDTARMLDVDATAAIATAAAAAELMLPRGRGRIALVSSLAALHPLPSCPSYCAAKAAARVYGLALGAWLAPRGIRVTVVCPGYVVTPMSERLEGAKPFLWTAERAAAHIRRRLAAGPAEIIFPRALATGIRLLALCPGFLRARLLKRFSFTVRPDAESPARAGAGR